MPKPTAQSLPPRRPGLAGPALTLTFAVLAQATLPPPALAAATTPAAQQAGYEAQAGRAGDAARGQALFNTTHGQDWRCASCHGTTPTGAGRHASTGKPIAPLAPAAEPRRFTDAAKTEKWFGRNCRDVLDRACSPAEKADVLAWLRSLQP